MFFNSIGAGCAVVAVISGLLALVWTQIRMASIARLLTFVAPLVVSYTLYWYPVWMGSDSSEYGSWAPLFIAPWSAVGIAGSLLVFGLVRGTQKRKREQVLHFYHPEDE